MKRFLTIAAIIALLFVSPARAASVYYSAPSGSGSTCTISAPCSLTTGLGKLASGDTLYLHGGTYATRVSVSKSNITIAGYPGETAILNGTGISGSGWVWMLDVTGSHDTFQDFEVQWPNGQGVWLEYSATYTTVRNLNIHNLSGVGINVWGNNSLLENNTIWRTNQNNIPPSGSDWSAAISVGDQNAGHGGYGNNVTVHNNKVYQNGGEGIMYTYVDGGLIESNTAWDNWAVNIYLDQASLTTIQRNFVYYDTDKTFFRDGNVPAAGIEFSNEGIISYPVGHDVKILNNIVVNTGLGINFWQGKVSGSGVINSLIANNTISNTYSGYYEAMAIDAGSHSNSFIENNIISSAATLSTGSSATGITWSNNLWSRSPGFSKSGDIVGNPQFAGGTFSDPAAYALQSSSPAIGKALVLSGVTVDFFGNARKAAPDIGAVEYGGSLPTVTMLPDPSQTPIPVTSTPTNTFTPSVGYTQTPTATNTPRPTRTFTPTSGVTMTPVPTFTPTFTNTLTFTPTLTNTVIKEPTFTQTPVPSDTPTITPAPATCSWVIDAAQTTAVHIVMDWICK